MKKIESRQNPNFKQALKFVQDSRNFPDLVLVEGEKLIDEALQAGACAKTFFMTARTENRFPQLHDISIELTPSLFKELSTVVSPADSICIFEKPAPPSLGEVVAKASLLVIFDRLQDPGNIGTIIRTSEAMGADAAILLHGSCSSNNSKVIRAAMGSNFRLPLFDRIDTEDLFTQLEKNNFVCICADMKGDSIVDFAFPDRSALFFGQEGSGVSEFIKNHCAMKLAIPMQGQVESLNVATSAAICLYEWSKQRLSRI